MAETIAPHEFPAIPDDREIAHLADPRRPPPGLFQFSLGTLLLVTTLIAGCLGLMVAVPELGAPLTIIVVLALIRTLVECRRTLRDGRTPRLAEKLGSFGGSLCFTFIAVVSMLLTLFFLSGVAMMIASAAGAVAETIGGRPALVITVTFLGLIFTVGVLCGSGFIFAMLYWTTIAPRLTLDEPPGRRAGQEPDTPR